MLTWKLAIIFIYTLSGEGERILTEAILSPRYGSRRKERRRRKTILKVIDDNWEEFNKMIDDIFAGKKIKIKKIKYGVCANTKIPR